MQTKQPAEIIVADANSKDKTREIAKKNNAIIVDGGLPSIGRNAGAKRAKSDLLIFFDADVRLPNKHYLSDTIQEFQKRKLDIATCDVLPLKEEESFMNMAMLKTYNAYAHILQKIWPHAPGFCIFIKKKIHNKINGFDEQILLAEDHDYVQRASKFGSFGVLQCHPILTSSRRFEKDGHLKTIAKYIACELYISAIGSVKSDLFKYRFGYDNLKQNKKITDDIQKSLKKALDKIQKINKDLIKKITKNE